MGENWFVNYRHGATDGNIDPSSAGGKEYIQSALRNLYAQGYRYFKTDFSQVARVESGYADPTLTSFQAQRLLYSIMRDAIGEDSYLLACNGGPMRAVLGLADATRIGTDSGTKWAFCHGINEFGKPSNVHGGWFPILQIGNASFYTHLMACDPDVTRLDNVGYADYDPRFNGMDPRDPTQKMPVQLSLGSVKTFHSIQGLFGGTMMVSDRIDQPGYQFHNRLRMFEIMHPCTAEKGYNFAGGSDILCRQFGFAAEREWGNFVSMMVCNPDYKQAQDLKMDLAPLESMGDRFHLWSFWDETYLGVQDNTYVFRAVPTYHSKLVRLTAVDPRGYPTVVGSNFHMGMGASEIEQVRATADGIAIELKPSAAAIEGQVVVFSAKPLTVTHAEGCQAFAASSGNQVYTAIITDRDRGATRQVVTLEVTDEPPPTLDEIATDPALGPKYLAGTMTVLQ